CLSAAGGKRWRDRGRRFPDPSPKKAAPIVPLERPPFTLDHRPRSVGSTNSPPKSLARFGYMCGGYDGHDPSHNKGESTLGGCGGRLWPRLEMQMLNRPPDYDSRQTDLGCRNGWATMGRRKTT